MIAPQRRADTGGLLRVGGPYRALEVLGSGASAVVYRAVHEVHGGEAAVKVFRQDLSDVARQRFAVESSIQWRLSDHPNVVRLFHASGLDVAHLWTVMELYETSLDALLRSNSRPDAWMSCQWGLDLVRGLAAVHVEGHLHRDVKPSNLLIKDGRAALSDFGCSLVAGEEAGGLVGTPRYLAPELMSGAAATTRSDVYAAGMTLRRLWGEAMPPGLAQVVDRATSYDPSDRPVDALALLEDLEALQPASRAVVSDGSLFPEHAGVDDERTFCEQESPEVDGDGSSGLVSRRAEVPRWAAGIAAAGLVVALVGSLVTMNGGGSLTALPKWAAEQVAVVTGLDKGTDVTGGDDEPATTDAGSSAPTTLPPTTLPPEAISPTASPTPTGTPEGREETSATSTPPPDTPEPTERESARVTPSERPSSTSEPEPSPPPTSGEPKVTPEPVELERFAPEREEELSTGQPGDQTTILFINDSSQPVEVYFLHPGGRQLMVGLAPGQAGSVNTMVKHAFIVTDQNQQGMFIVTAVPEQGRVTLQ